MVSVFVITVAATGKEGKEKIKESLRSDRLLLEMQEKGGEKKNQLRTTGGSTIPKNLKMKVTSFCDPMTTKCSEAEVD